MMRRYRYVGLCLLLFGIMWEGQAQEFVEERVHLHVDRSVYVAGEAIQFSIVCRDARWGKASLLSKVGMVELWNGDGQVIQRVTVTLREGRGEGRFLLNRQLPSDYYYLRAYTQWMTNQPPSSFFTQRIGVIQADRPIPLANDNVPAKAPKFEIDLFPEGGNWIADLPQRAVVKVTPWVGQDVLGQLKSTVGDTIFFVPNAMGLAEVAFTPQANAQYGVFLFGPDTTTANQFISLPVKETGVSLRLDWEPKARLVVTCRKQGDIKEPLSLVIKQGGIELHQQPLSFQNDQSQETIHLPPTVSGTMLVQVENEDEVLAEDYVWVSNSPQTTLSLEPFIPTEPKVDTFSLKLQVWGEESISQEAQLSVSVARQTGLFPVLSADDRVLSARIKPIPASLGDTVPMLPTLFGPEVSGRVAGRSLDSVAGATVWLSLLGAQAQLYVTRADSTGQFRIPLPGTIGRQEIIVWAETLGGNPLVVKLAQASDFPFEVTDPLSFVLPTEERANISELVNTYRLQQAFAQGEGSTPVGMVASSFYGKPDEVYLLDDYTRFVMEETFREITYYVEVKGNQQNRRLRVEDKRTEDLFEGEPLVMLDGVPILNMNKVWELNTKKVSRIEVVRESFQFNHLTFGGIIHLISYKEDARATAFPDHYVRTFYTFPQPALRTEARIESGPHFRNTLYWSPDMRTDEQGQATIHIPLRDAHGKFMVSVKVLTAEGEWLEQEVELPSLEP